MQRFITIFFMAMLMISCFRMDIFACHSGDLGANLKGHYKWSKNWGGIFRYTEGITAFTSITTWCDLYTHFISHEYELIAEDASQGQGEHLIALAQLMGCKTESHPEFASALQARYVSLFDKIPPTKPDLFLEKLKEMIAQVPNLEQTCNS